MTKNEMTLIKESGSGKLYESNGFVVPVLSGSDKEMGAQYGALMVEHMQQVWDRLAEPAIKAGAITDEVMRRCTDRAYTRCSTRMRQFNP